MEEHNLTNEQILAFSTALFQAERSQATVEKYLRSVRAFSLFLDGQPVTKDIVLAWKKHLQREENYSPSTVNASLAALNCLFSFLGWTDCRTHYLKIQRRLFRETGRELDRADYEKLITAARGLGRARIALVMETICATGIRVGEVRYITVEAVRVGSATISLKGKILSLIHILSATALSQTTSRRVFQLRSQTAYVCFHVRKRVHARLCSKNRTQRLTRRNVCALDVAILGDSCYTDGHRKPLKKFFYFFLKIV